MSVVATHLKLFDWKGNFESNNKKSQMNKSRIQTKIKYVDIPEFIFYIKMEISLQVG